MLNGIPQNSIANTSSTLATMFHIVLYQPEIPPNTGNVMRLSANIGCHLHLIRPFGFDLDDKKLRRAGLDYSEWACVRDYPSLDRFTSTVQPRRMFACSTKGRRCYSNNHFETGDAFVFGPETRGLPHEVLATFAPDHVLRIPMVNTSRSLNLSNAVAIVLFEAWRQVGFEGTEF